MAVRAILTWPDPRLSTPCAPVGTGADLDALIADMFDTMYAAPGRGLAAPQIGVMQRVFVMDATWKDGAGTPRALINPRITAQSDETASADEGCLSIPGVSVAVTRPAQITVAWSAPDGTALSAQFDGFEAACIQHEIDHLDGIVTFDRLAPADRTRAEAAYAGAQA